MIILDLFVRKLSPKYRHDNDFERRFTDRDDNGFLKDNEHEECFYRSQFQLIS